MRTYPSEHWKALGDWIASARTQLGHTDTKMWAGLVGRSTRQVLGLERGEPVGPKTIEGVAKALEISPAELFVILESGTSERTWMQMRADALDVEDRAALARPEESQFWTTPQGDEAGEPVTWSHMEGRLSEIESRILRLERTVLRAINAMPRGGDGNEGGTAPMKDEELSDQPPSLRAVANRGDVEPEDGELE